ncbi:hypothetical protein MKW92_053938 [Papaver armeniacum]|nr:hypothetical protein MKW92_053938 [Papaver armeniacum]
MLKNQTNRRRGKKMKYMKIGTRPDTFFAEEDTRSVLFDLPVDLVIQINNTKFLLHKIQLLPKCGILRQICSGSDDSNETEVELHDIPGGEEAFELCTKFCYGITINLSAHNLVPALCAAKFLRMTESICKANFAAKLEAFFYSCILEGWKDSIVTLQTTTEVPDWSENLGITRRCIDSIVEKILVHTSKVTIQSTNILPSTLIGEALHVYAYKWLPKISSKSSISESSVSQTEEMIQKQRKVLDSIVSMIPTERGSVSVGFLLKLLRLASLVGAHHSTKAELIRRSSRQLEDATVDDLLIPLHSSLDQHFYDTNLVGALLDKSESVISVRRVGKLIDSYLQVVARDGNMPVSKIVSLAESLPEIARLDHDELYKAINIYLKEHTDISKEDKKRLCRILDCQKLSPKVCAHVVKNERLPLRTVVQVLFFDQERNSKVTSRKPQPTETILESFEQPKLIQTAYNNKPERVADKQNGQRTSEGEATTSTSEMRSHHQIMRRKQDIGVLPESEITKAMRETAITEGASGSKLEFKKETVRRSKSGNHSANKSGTK